MKKNIEIIKHTSGNYTIKLGSEVYLLNKSKYSKKEGYTPYYLLKAQPQTEYISGMFEKKEKNKHYFQGKYEGKAIIINITTAVFEIRSLRQAYNLA